ncbi:MAG: methyltransferase domain-containing protein [Pseudonocardiaceae bacterium]
MTTTLDPAALWRAELVKTLVARGVLTDPVWREAFATVPREVFVPRFARREQGGQLVHYDHAAEGGTVDFFAAVYSDTSLITRFNAAGVATSSSSQPSLMAIMLDRLDIRDGHTVLEIGAGTGYNAALLTHRLGNEAVTTIDVDPDIVLEAEYALTHAGYHPTVVCGNGADGVLIRAPFDRIIATCGVSRIPKAWITQTKPGGRILANISLGLIALTVTTDGTAIGQFDTESAAFMPLHDEPADTTPPLRDILAMTRGDGVTRRTTTRPQLDYPDSHPVIDFLVALILPGICHTLLPLDPPTYVLVDPVSGSWARAYADGHTAVVTEHDPRVLWDELSAVITEWVNLGQPEASDYSLTIDAAGTHHLHHPESGWTLALP